MPRRHGASAPASRHLAWSSRLAPFSRRSPDGGRGGRQERTARRAGTRRAAPEGPKRSGWAERKLSLRPAAARLAGRRDQSALPNGAQVGGRMAERRVGKGGGDKGR